jgi:ligand-binding sensor domain-containing protein
MKDNLKPPTSAARGRAASIIQRLRSDRRAAIIGVAILAIVGGTIFFFVRWINSRIVAEGRQVEVRVASLRAPSTDGFSVYLDASDVRAVAEFAGSHYLATSGGLIALDQSFNVKRRYTTSEGLPENDLTVLAVFRERLFIGTAGSGLVSFDGTSFTGYSFIKPKAARVSALAATESELLIGTLDGGVFEFDGETFTRRYNSTAGGDFNKITALLPYESRLYIGTQESGLYIWREAHIERITTTEGLPSPHVTALAAMPSSLSDNGVVAVATDFGVSGLGDANEIKAMTNRPNITSLAASGGRLWAGLFGGGVIDLGAEQAIRTTASTADRSTLSETPGLPPAAPATVQSGEGRLWALTREGAFVRDEAATGPGFEGVAGGLAGGVLSAGHVTGLALDSAGRLWVGYFDRGVDTISLETGERLSHIEDDRVREINFLGFDAGDGRLLAATSRGLVIFDGNSGRSVLTREQGGLIDNSIAHVTVANVTAQVAARGAATVGNLEGRALVLATPKGLTQVLGGRARSITAFHGLANNHIYTSAAVGSRLFAGSLAGLVELEGLRVIRTYTTSNSQLSHDWVSALANADGTLYVGTNGGGVDALLPTGEWVNFSDQVGKFEVNQNAMHFDGERVYVGTGDRGILVYNTRARRWNQVSAGLPSPNVTAITSDERFVYAGTMNGLVRIEKRVIG